jgi:hypothetical protein
MYHFLDALTEIHLTLNFTTEFSPRKICAVIDCTRKMICLGRKSKVRICPEWKLHGRSVYSSSAIAGT